MLDQNTDRMWFVIGAVIVGAAIIFIANGTLPEIFASVTNSFEDVANQGILVVEEIGTNEYTKGVPEEIESYNMIEHRRFSVGLFSYNSGSPISQSNSFRQLEGSIPVVPGESYILSHQLQDHPNGTIGVEIAWHWQDATGKWIGGDNAYAVNHTTITAPAKATAVRIRFGFPQRLYSAEELVAQFKSPGFFMGRESDVQNYFN